MSRGRARPRSSAPRRVRRWAILGGHPRSPGLRENARSRHRQALRTALARPARDARSTTQEGSSLSARPTRDRVSPVPRSAHSRRRRHVTRLAPRARARAIASTARRRGIRRRGRALARTPNELRHPIGVPAVLFQDLRARGANAHNASASRSTRDLGGLLHGGHDTRGQPSRRDRKHARSRTR